MRNLFLLIVITFIVINVKSQGPSNCNAPISLTNAYEIDVSDLAIGRMFDIKSADTNQIIIPQSYKDTIWHGLAAIFNAFTFAERDSVFDIYCIHNYSAHTLSIFHNINVGVDMSYIWTKQWLKMHTTTYYKELDDLLAKYGFTIYHFDTIFGAAAWLMTSQNINVFALCDSLKLFDGITYAYPSNSHGDGDRIEYNKISDDQFFDFTLAWGDCWSGCYNHHKWKYKVNYSNCTVDYLGLELHVSDPLPNPVNCNITTSIMPVDQGENPIMIYPNPTNSFITIEAEKIQKIEILDVLGQLIIKNEIKGQIFRIDMDQYVPGIYFVKVSTDLETRVQKIIKQ